MTDLDKGHQQPLLEGQAEQQRRTEPTLNIHDVWHPEDKYYFR